jgi:hypothetical protein
MTQAELEHAATAPQRFRSLLSLRREGEEKVLPVVTRFLESERESGCVVEGGEGGDGGREGKEREKIKFGYVNLVPGGRWMTTRSYDNVLQIWDLGCIGGGFEVEEGRGARPVAEYALGEGHVHFEPDVHLMGDGEGLLVAMSQVIGGRFVLSSFFPPYISQTTHLFNTCFI